MTTNNHQIYYEDEANRQYYKRSIEKALYETKNFCCNFKCSNETLNKSCPLWDYDNRTCAKVLLELALNKFQKKDKK